MEITVASLHSSEPTAAFSLQRELSALGTTWLGTTPLWPSLWVRAGQAWVASERVRAEGADVQRYVMNGAWGRSAPPGVGGDAGSF